MIAGACGRVCPGAGSGRGHEEKRKLTLRFRRANLDYSIRNYAFIESHTMGDDEECSKHMVADICEEGNRDRVTRLLATIHAGVVEMLYPFTKRPATEAELTDDFVEPSDYVIDMEVPASFSQTSADLMRHLIHEYMVSMVLHDWLTITDAGHPEAAAHWLAKATEAAEEIERLKSSRTGPLRRRLDPVW